VAGGAEDQMARFLHAERIVA